MWCYRLACRRVPDPVADDLHGAIAQDAQRCPRDQMALCMFAKEGSEIVVVHASPWLSPSTNGTPVDANETPELLSARADG